MDRLGEFHRVVMRNLIVLAIEEISRAILFKDRAKDPAVAVVIRELGVFQPGIELRNLFQKVQVAPESARGGRLGILLNAMDEFLVRRIFLLSRVHELAIRFLIPPGVAEVRVHEEISLVHVAIHALCSGDGTGELVFDGMPALILANGFVGREAQPLVAEPGIPTRMRWGAIVRVNHMAGGAAARTIVSRMVVRAHKVQQRIMQACLLQPQKDRVGAIQSAQPAFGKAASRLARGLEWVRVSQLQLLPSAALENTQYIAGLTLGETRQWFDEGQNPMELRHLRGNGDWTIQAERHAIARISLSEAIIFGWIRTVVVERRSP